MSLTLDEVKHIAHLARLELSAEELELYRQQLSSILDHVAQLDELDTADVEPLTSVLAEQSELRVDEPGQALPLDKLLGNAPDTDRDQFKVPPILD
ncbi:MAG: Asp-tRNA(Asn)/Glu-tRNA(Gln) amidotransferase subunit GatC [Chloroflexi bacterium]|nr:MAG: Asp-tRNA(Asn)/Glu-tRNA(Gln) amidotransferase subunit GatC [Chloroflexota bacterium]MBL1192904.1 Asp-tRNA(Asn)/Glu-tRNA(Gln) amidotransferase subunit GatC [Chloroflexota bacterium]NOH10196.1 Asp-tRNA(Asn)/Glu-tRNA(Gln) amidotransferase subunit GatC [Chloroflexota bacterium]